MEDEEYKKLPLEDRCTHKLWKARVNGYEEAAKLFGQLDDDKSPEFGKYLGLVKKFVTDSNALGQEKGLEATLAFVENYANAGKTVNEVMSGVVTKCIAAPKTRTRELALQLTLMYIEIEKYEAVEEELIKGMEQKNPKIVAACINACTTALREFGSKVITLKPLVKKISVLFSDRDKAVRDEARHMVIEMYRWIGAALRPQLSNLQPVQVTELEAEFAKIDGQKAAPIRFIRSQQQKQAQMAAEATEAEDDEEEEGETGPDAVDAYDLADPVDVLSKLPKDFYEKLEAKKWQDRKEALESLEGLVKVPKLENGDYGDLVRALKKVVQKDSNVLVVALACKCVFGLAAGLKKRFQPYSGAMMPALLEKFKEKKQNVVTALKEAIDAVYLSTTIEAILEDVIEALNNKNPSVKSETASFLARAFSKTLPTALNKKMLKAITTALIKNINEPDPTVRDCSADAIGTLMKLVGEKAIGSFLVEVEKDNLKMTKIRECCEKAVITVKVPTVKKERPATAPTKKMANGDVKSGAPAGKASKRPISVAKSASANSLDKDDDEDSGSSNVPTTDASARLDISNQITEALINELSDKNWKVRNEALVKIQTILTETKLIKPNIGDLPQALALRLVDSNSKIAQTAIGLCETIAVAMGPPSRHHIRTWFPGLLQSLGDSKAWVRSAALLAMNALGEQCAYKEFFEGEMIGDALKAGSPTLRSELWAWLAEKLPKIKTVPKEEIMICIPYLYTNLEDRNADVRKNAQEAVLGLMMHTSYEAMTKQTEKLKHGSKTVVMAALDKARPNLPVKPLPSKKAAAEKEEKAVRGTKAAANSKNAVKKPGAGAAAQKQSRKKEEDVDTSPLLAANNAKYQRTLDESKLKVLKWNFTTPREEFVDLLKEQMTSANVNKSLIANMFHSDFRYHIKALESLAEDLPENGAATIANLDLILKWLTLRFFDTNPSVLLKGLEYLHSVFNVLIENQYHLVENEAASFIPYLILKVGDPKDSVRNGVRSLFKQICNVYSVSKLFMYIVEGLKSKNARQRAECLEVMGSIIEDYGINVCLPSPAACLKEVAKQISDRDNSVRNAALNCVVQAYYIVGEKVYKMVGQISDKDMSLLEERIKRASKRPAPPKKVEPTISPQRERQPSPENLNSKQEQPEDEEEAMEEEEDNIPQIQVSRDSDRYFNNTFTRSKFRVPSAAAAAAVQEDVPQYFKLDPDFIKRLDSISANVPKLKLSEFNVDFLSSEITVPSIEKIRTNMTPMSPPKPIVPNQSFTRRSLDRPLITPTADHIHFQKLLREIASADLPVALRSLLEMHDIFQGSKAHLMVDYENQFMISVATQLRILYPQNPQADTEVCRGYRRVLTCVDAFYANKNLGEKVSVEAVRSLLYELIRVLVDTKLEGCPNGESYIRVINLHCVRIIERSDHSNVICALVQLLHSCVKNDEPPRIIDLAMKCIWRAIKIMPTWGDNLHYDNILYDVHVFLKDYPTSWWKTKSSDTPLRTIKTILHSVTKTKGAAIMLHLGKIPDTNESEVENYILRLLKSLKLEEAKPSVPKVESTTTTTTTARATLSRANHAQLTDIFQKIGNKEESKEGLMLLYDFTQQHPEANIEPFLSRSSTFFQEYIKKGLRDIEETRKSNTISDKVKEKLLETKSSSGETGSSDEKSVEYYRDRLQMWNRVWDETLNRKNTD